MATGAASLPRDSGSCHLSCTGFLPYRPRTSVSIRLDGADFALRWPRDIFEDEGRVLAGDVTASRQELLFEEAFVGPVRRRPCAVPPLGGSPGQRVGCSMLSSATCASCSCQSQRCPTTPAGQTATSRRSGTHSASGLVRLRAAARATRPASLRPGCTVLRSRASAVLRARRPDAIALPGNRRPSGLTDGVVLDSVETEVLLELLPPLIHLKVATPWTPMPSAARNALRTRHAVEDQFGLRSDATANRSLQESDQVRLVLVTRHEAILAIPADGARTLTLHSLSPSWIATSSGVSS